MESRGKAPRKIFDICAGRVDKGVCAVGVWGQGPQKNFDISAVVSINLMVY